MTSPEAPLNLIGLARSEPGRPVTVPGTGLAVMAIESSTPENLNQPLWVVVVDGDLIVDLPHGDFRHLKVGDSILLPAVSVSFEPVEPVVMLRQDA